MFEMLDTKSNAHYDDFGPVMKEKPTIVVLHTDNVACTTKGEASPMRYVESLQNAS
jgi:hypothetical protein